MGLKKDVTTSYLSVRKFLLPHINVCLNQIWLPSWGSKINSGNNLAVTSFYTSHHTRVKCFCAAWHLCLFSITFRVCRCGPSVGPTSSTRQQLQELYTQVPQVRLHFSHGFVSSLFGLSRWDYLCNIWTLISATHTQTSMHAEGHWYKFRYKNRHIVCFPVSWVSGHFRLQ